MAIPRFMTWKCNWRRGALPAIAALLVGAQALAADLSPAQGRVPRPVIEAAEGKACVADPAFMRKNHMDLLKHQRDDTMHRGVREPKYSLKGCIACHANKATNSVVAGDGNFCQSCHRYAGVTLDCFECHTGTRAAAPKPATAANAVAAVNGDKP